MQTKPAGERRWSSGSGLLLILVSLGVAVFDSSNFLAFGLAFFVLLIGIMLVMMGFLGVQNEQKKPPDPVFCRYERGREGQVQPLQRSEP